MASKEIKSLKITDKSGQSYMLAIPNSASELAEFKAQIEAIKKDIEYIKANYPLLDELDEFDKESFKSEILAELRG